MASLRAIDRENQYDFFYNGLRSTPLNFPGSPSVINWNIPNKLLDASFHFLNWPPVDRFIKTDLVFSPHFNILKTSRAPRVITFHDLSFLHHPYFFSLKQRFWHWLQDAAGQAREARQIIAVSEFTKADLVHLLGIAPEKITTVYSGISEEFRRVPVADQDVRPFFLSLGTLEPRKNVPAIIQAFNILKQEAQFADWQLVIAGRPGWIHQRIDKEAARSPFRSDIIFTGSVPARERVLLYNVAKVFVYPSFFEGFGFPPLEAQACGCPVVASDRTSLPEVLGKSALLVNPWKSEELAMAMREAALNGRVRDRLVAAGLENAARFTWNAAARQTLEVFQRCV